MKARLLQAKLLDTVPGPPLAYKFNRHLSLYRRLHHRDEGDAQHAN